MMKQYGVGWMLFAAGISTGLAALVMLNVSPLSRPPNTDSGVFLYIGRQIVNGNFPYLDVWDHKGPLLYYLNAAGLRAANGQAWGVWGIEFFLLTLALFFVFDLVYAVGGVLAAAGAVLSGFYFLKLFVLGNLTEEYYLFFACLIFYLFYLANKATGNQRVLFLLIGLAAAGGFLLRPNNIGAPLAVMIALAIIDLRRKDYNLFFEKSGFFLIGFLILNLIFIVYFGFHGVLSNYIDQVFVYNLVYSGFHRAGAESVWPNHPLIGWTSLLGYLLVVCLVVYSYWTEKDRPDSVLPLLILIGFPLEVLLSSISGRWFEHYYITWIPVLMLTVGYLVFRLFELFSLDIKASHDWMFFAAAVVTILLVRLDGFGKYVEIVNRLVWNRSEGVAKLPFEARYFRDKTGTECTVLIWGHGGSMNFLSQRDAPSRYLYQSAPLFTPGYTTLEMSRTFLAELQNSQPELVVVYDFDPTSPFNTQMERAYQGYLPPLYDDIQRYFLENYHFEEIMKQPDMKIYRINTSTCAPEN